MAELYVSGGFTYLIAFFLLECLYEVTAHAATKLAFLSIGVDAIATVFTDEVPEFLAGRFGGLVIEASREGWIAGVVHFQ